MILDGDVLAYFEALGVDVIHKECENHSTFQLVLSYHDFDVDLLISLYHGKEFLEFTAVFPHPKNYDLMPEAMNVLNCKTDLKAYYERLEDTVKVEISSYVREENLKRILEDFVSLYVEEESEYIENLYNSLYRETYISSEADSLEEPSDDTSIEEDLAELYRLIGKV